MDKILLENLLSDAIKLFKENNISFGKSKLKKILEFEPNHFDALNLNLKRKGLYISSLVAGFLAL